MVIRTILFCTVLFILSSCGGSQSVYTHQFKDQRPESEVLLSVHNKAKETILVIPDDDTVSIQEQFDYLMDILPQKRTIALFPKLFYKNPVDKNSIDVPEARKETIANNYNLLIQQGILDSNLPVTIVAIGEGTLIAPQLTLNLHVKKLVLINPYMQSMSENLIGIYNEEGRSFLELSKFSGLRTKEDWASFFLDAQNGQNPDRYPTYKPMRYYSKYWNYDPTLFLRSYSEELHIIQFEDYHYTSQVNKNKAQKKGVNNFTLFAGNMYTNTFKKDLKQILNN